MVLLLGIALVLAIVIKAFLMQAFYIPSASMNDTLVKNDRILVQKVSYWGSAGPHRGDIVVFADPGGWLDGSETQAPDSPVARVLELFTHMTGDSRVAATTRAGSRSTACR